MNLKYILQIIYKLYLIDFNKYKIKKINLLKNELLNKNILIFYFDKNMQ